MRETIPQHRSTEAIQALARTCGLYRWGRCLSIHDLARIALVPMGKVLQLEIQECDRLTDDEWQRLEGLVSATAPHQATRL
jgi:hypothetical protein